MGETIIKYVVGLVSFAVWIILLIFLIPLRNTLLLNPVYFSGLCVVLSLYLSLPIFFIWLMFGWGFGLFSAFVSIVFFIVFLGPWISDWPMALFAFTGFLGYRLKKSFDTETKCLEVDMEKLEESLNILSDGIKSSEKDNLRMRDSLKKTYNLKGIVENYSLSLTNDEVLDSIVNSCSELFEEANRILLYLVDTDKQELMLVRSKKRAVHFPIKAKKGDVFDRWILKHRIPLLVENIYKDFRFSLNGNIDKGFNSLISSPLISGEKVLGLVRADSIDKNAFTQSDVRFLDIITDLATVSLDNAILYEKVQNLALHDSLTGLYVHKYFVERLKHEVSRSLRNNRDTSLLMLDLDDFKDYNDKYGHNMGDLILRHISSILTVFASPGDIISRYGGEEFAFLLFNKNKSAAFKVADEIRKKISSTPLILRRKETNITVSIGLATCPREASASEEFLRLADSRLYKAKKSGKNMVCAE